MVLENVNRQADSVTVSLMHVDMHVTPARMDTSCCRKRTILVVKVASVMLVVPLGWDAMMLQDNVSVARM